MKIEKGKLETRVYFTATSEFNRDRQEYISISHNSEQPIINIPATGGVTLETGKRLQKAIDLAIMIASGELGID